MKRQPEITLRQLKATIFGVCFASTVAIVGIAVGVKPTILTSLAAYHQEACANNPVLLSWTQHALPVMPTFLGILLALPLACAAYTLCRQVRETLALQSYVQRNSRHLPAKLTSVARSLRLVDRLVCVDDYRLYAFCFGFVSPRICVSAAMVRKLSKQELEAVLLHESHHLANRDPVKLLVSRIIASGLLLLPVANEVRERYQLAMELAADRKALARLPVPVLASALLKVFMSVGAGPSYHLAAVGALDVTRERISRLMGETDSRYIPPVSRSSFLTSAFVAMALFVGTIGISEASGYWADRGHNCRPIPTINTLSVNQPDHVKVTPPKCSHSVEGLAIPVEN